jgi:predicted nuclease with RNAse H fold
MLVAGVDVSGRSVGKTALAWLTGTSARMPTLVERPRDYGLNKKNGDDNLVRLITERAPVVVALDAPLGLPHPVTCRDPECIECFPSSGEAARYGRRRLEEPHRWTQLVPGMKGPMPSVMISAIAFRAIYLRRSLERHSIRVIETWPMGVYRILSRQDQHSAVAGGLGDDARAAILAAHVGGLDAAQASSRSRDSLDAIAAAYAAWCWASDRAHAVRSELIDEGEIWVPAPTL